MSETSLLDTLSTRVSKNKPRKFYLLETQKIDLPAELTTEELTRKPIRLGCLDCLD